MTQTSAEHQKIKPKAGQNPNKKKKPKAPKKITESYLYNSGLYYLQRFAASKAHFHKVMENKIKKSCAWHKEQNLEACLALLPPLIEQFEEAGMLNDESYTQGLINSLRRRGLSQQAILMRAKAKGVPAELARETLEEHDLRQHESQREADLQAALLLARKKRLGPFAKPCAEDERQKQQTRQLSAFARAGYSYDIASKIMEMNEEEALDALRSHI